MEILKPFLGITSKRTLDVFGLLLYFNDKKKEITNINDRFKILFDYDTKIEITEILGISIYTLNNEFANLRKKNLIQHYNKLNPGVLIYPDDKFTLSFNFTIDEKKTEG